MDVTRDTYDDGSRYYTDGETEIVSVTTVLDHLDEDTSGLDYWKGQNDGSGDAPYWQHIFWYSAPRGTLCHYQALQHFEDAFEYDEMWGEEEGESMAQVSNGPADDAFDSYDDPDAPTDKNEVTYSILKDQGIVESRDQYDALFADSTSLDDVLRDDIEWFVEKFEYICEKLGVDSDAVLRVEKFMHEPSILVAGQTDLVYEDRNGDIVVADLKTSSGLRQKHRLQSVAYMKAVEEADWGPSEVDRVEVWRIAPSKREYEVHSHKVPEHAEEYDWFTDEHWFVDPYGNFEYESIEEMWEKFQSLTETANEQAGN